MKIIHISTIVISMLLTAGCKTNPVVGGLTSGTTSGSTSPVSGKDLATEATTVKVDPSLLVSCRSMPLLQDTNPSPNVLLEHKAEEVKVYADCRTRYTALIETVRKAFNINQP